MEIRIPQRPAVTFAIPGNILAVMGGTSSEQEPPLHGPGGHHARSSVRGDGRLLFNQFAFPFPHQLTTALRGLPVRFAFFQGNTTVRFSVGYGFASTLVRRVCVVRVTPERGMRPTSRLLPLLTGGSGRRRKSPLAVMTPDRSSSLPHSTRTLLVSPSVPVSDGAALRTIATSDHSLVSIVATARRRFMTSTSKGCTLR